MGRSRMSKDLEQLEQHGPPRLSVDSLELEGEQFAVFAWDVDRPRGADLTQSERHVLELLVSGASNADIARARRASVRTVANQVASVLRKLGAASRYELIQRFGTTRGRAH
ncbi:response regulator transcription factor [Pyxidicoccus xibeiensis]|uniref:response regulator transcription factor n=1 Tax=Pyxidicoccus xibeiensis TaxID=2906759 RepID=UPI0020A79E88|nr:helix-turn-helix transcriptional regulator [Pyxidicoccus xibeiensis]MCP3139763.1 helix-turn-helix transcriptional regulator [Pyxidicoccus xibeiensis]